MDVSVVVATYGDKLWLDLAQARAVPSAVALGVPVIWNHSETLHEARNYGLEMVKTEWVCHLDADDELEPGYFDAMEQGTADVRAPRVRYVYEDREARPRMPRVAGHTFHDCTADCLTEGNWLVVGSLVRADLARQVGGWRDFSWSEDWDLWLRCHLAGASFEPVPDAIYRAYVREDSRNRAPDRQTTSEAHAAIARANGLLPA